MYGNNKYTTFAEDEIKVSYTTMKKKLVKKGKKTKKALPKIKEKRTHRVSFMLNDTEFMALQRHVKKYKITNKANWFRRTVLAHIWQKLEADFPMLFEEDEMRQGTSVSVENA